MQPDGSTNDSIEREQTYSPLVRRLAEEFGVDLTTVVGTGPGGRVTRADVQNVAFGDSDGAESTAPAVAPSVATAGASVATAVATVPEPADIVTIDGDGPLPSAPEHRRTDDRAPEITIHEPSTEPASSSYTVFLDVAAEQLLRAQRRLTEDRADDVPLIALIVRLTVAAFDMAPELHPEPTPISVAVTGLAEQPVHLSDAERLSLIDLSGRLTPGSQPSGADEGRAPVADLIIDDLSMTGARSATPRLPIGATAAITIGQPQGQVQLVDGQPRQVPVLTLAGTFTSDLAGSSVGARFLAAVASNLEDPILAFAD